MLRFPGIVDSAYFSLGMPRNRPVNEVIQSVGVSILRFGYAAVVLHPQQFAVCSGKTLIDEIDRNTIDYLSQLFRWATMNTRVVKILELSTIPVPEYPRTSTAILTIARATSEGLPKTVVISVETK